MSAEEILEALDPEQREVATALHGPVCVLAGAGTGKTRAMTHRIAYGVRVNAYAPQSVLAVTFTARAAGEMRTRLRDLGVEGVQARTFHAAALRQLGYFWPQVIGGSVPQLLEHKAPLVGQAARQVGVSVDRIAVRDLASEIEWAKVSLVAADDYLRVAASQDRPAPAGFERSVIADLMRAYEDVKGERGVLDFEDILLLLADMIGRHGEVGEAIRRQYKTFVVDEYQDVSPLQQFVLEQWMGGREDLCVVGDPYQTIYSFAGASPRYLLDFRKTYPDAAVVKLVRDYRSTPQVVALANGMMAGRAHAGQRGGHGQADGVTLVAQRPKGPEVSFRAFADDGAESLGVADAIEGLIASGVKPSEIAILYRTNGQSEELEGALSSRGIGYLVRGGQRFFQREEVKKGVLALRAATVAAGPDDEVAVVVRMALSDVGWSEEPPAARGATRERWDSLQALVSLGDDWTGTMREFVADLDERAAAQHAPTVEGVTLSTMHAAKGLEWDAVFIVGMSEGLMPISLAEGEENIEEERRLLYVGVTRAREHLTLSFARSRKEGGRATRKRTRFLEQWWPDGASARPRNAKKAALADLSVEDLKVFEALKQWRLGRAQEADKPAFTVLVDSTLIGIATARPGTLGELVQVQGIGPSKLDAYGLEILTIVAEHA